ncbi:MAG TPA: nuclear transport factor 2 family protein [Terriglobales bacterium]|jgi:ketosteroid isomerase-like protein
MLLFALFLSLLLQTSAPGTDQTIALLRAKDQALLNATAPADKKIWEDVLAPDAVFVDENGAILDRATFLEQLTPLPAGVSGTLQISNFQAHVDGDLATVIHLDDEHENFHGQALFAQYLTTETWRRDDGTWKLYLTHIYAVLKDPPSITLPQKELRQYAGQYTAAPDLIYVIHWDGQRLVGGRKGSSMKPLDVEVRDVLFVPGQPRIRKIFQRNDKGKITGFVDRRESWDLVWKKSAS